MLRLLDNWIDHLLTEKAKMKDCIQDHPMIIPDLEYFPTEFIQFVNHNGECFDGLLTYNYQSSHSFRINLGPFKHDHYYTTTTNIEGNLVNKWRLHNRFDVIHTMIKGSEVSLRLEVLALGIPSMDCDIPRALRASFLQKWTSDPLKEKLDMPHLLLGNNYKQYYPKLTAMTEEQKRKFPINRMYNSQLTGCAIFTGPLTFEALKNWAK